MAGRSKWAQHTDWLRVMAESVPDPVELAYAEYKWRKVVSAAGKGDTPAAPWEYWTEAQRNNARKRFEEYSARREQGLAA